MLASFVKTLIKNVLGLDLQPLQGEVVKITPEIQALLNERESARAAKDWARADAIRNELATNGYKIQDKKL